MPLLLNQAVVDVQYDRGATYFDKCGSLALKLQDQLGAAFEWSVPTVEFGQVQSPAERLVLRYSAKSFNVTQAWVSSVARVQHVAPPAWELVAETVGVSRTVTRCGVRFTLMWPTESLAIASTKISEARFWSASKDWASTVGDAACVAWSTILEDKRGKVRIALDAVETRVQGGSLPADLAKIVPNFSICIDFDHVYPGVGAYTLRPSDLKEFIRASWQRSKAAITIMTPALGVHLDDTNPADTGS